MAHTTYTVTTGDRWDLIAHYAYGDSYRFREIQKANPFVPVSSEPVPGTVLLVPIDESGTSMDTFTLPPWKQ